MIVKQINVKRSAVFDRFKLGLPQPAPVTSFMKPFQPTMFEGSYHVFLYRVSVQVSNFQY